ncbi:tol-pal system-associated acyl-CoA thioesterase [Uliginosibacterium sp. 31-12]|jgi:acyl-CoA thioester hydrolase|uniref:tol-pal system-associated acyl-CoA thioesterase n=1 Tax=Uliginosibacterium sp. 31-12 TaxID=3062781 RepID=UPI0026E2C35B|nr:tol-pal system-associated acyl-CoA thioesterase [Uliginosibacterium sp. 31-12]MDO6386684.1 tol-pal system-associated acyl-CoA thioesterase [Uliginosibacterium sp. 31-12]
MAPIHNTSSPRQSVWPVRVYYEDTDAGGVVYYANYLRFCERARTECLRALGINQHSLRGDLGIVFVVRRVEADYLRSAELDDELQVMSTIYDIGAASLKFEQHVLRGDTCLFKAHVTIACLDVERWRATRIPDFLRTLFESEA